MENVKTIEKEYKGSVWESALDKAFQKAKKDVKVDGFRAGAVPKEIFIKKYGIESLYNDAVDIILQENYNTVMEESKLEPVCQPKVDIKDINKDSLTLEFTIIVKPEVTLGAYTDLKVKKDKVKVTEEEISEEIKKLTSRFAEIVVKESGEVVEGNTVVIDYKGTMDGKEFDGGSAENYPLEIGSHTFIPGFEEGIVGMKKGEEKVLKLKFPENYAEELKGKDVSFAVKVNEIKERVLPELNKDFYEDLGYKDINTEEEFNAKIKEELEKRKSNEIENKYTEDCLNKAVEAMKVEINPEIIDDEVHRMLHQMDESLRQQGLTLDQYMQFTKTTHEDLHKQAEPEALKRIKERFLLETVAEKENIKPTKEEIAARIDELTKVYGVSKEELLEGFGGEDMITYDVKMRKALEIVTK